jgi:hypothetical protein
MSKARARYTEADVARVLKAAAKAHVDVRLKIDTAGNILIATGKGSEGGSFSLNEWDEELFNGPDQTAIR